MREINSMIASIHASGLDAALKVALPGKCFGLSTYGPARPISIWLDNATTGADDTTAQNVISAHDPVFLTVDRTTIKADNADAATITVSAPKANAAPVTLLFGGNAAPLTLVGGIGTLQITSAAPTIITISVQNPQNRTSDTLSIEAI